MTPMPKPPENGNPGVGRAGAESENKIADAQPVTHLQARRQAKLLREYSAALRRLDELELMSFWESDLAVKLWRTEQVFLYADANVDFGALADEVAAFQRACRILTWTGSASA
jgi:hypothetical protein